jgi:hypothetical protein
VIELEDKGENVWYRCLCLGGRRWWPEREITEWRMRWSGLWGIGYGFRNHRENMKPFRPLNLKFNGFTILPLWFDILTVSIYPLPSLSKHVELWSTIFFLLFWLYITKEIKKHLKVNNIDEPIHHIPRLYQLSLGVVKCIHLVLHYQ